MEYRFILTHNATSVTIIDSPDNNEAVENFNDFESEINRDFKTHGMVYQYSSGDLKLGFYGEAKTLLESAFQQDGLNANVSLEISKRNESVDDWVVVFTGTAVMANRSVDVDFFRCDFENTTFQEKIMSRWKTKVKLNQTMDLDGNTLNGSITSQTDDFNEVRKTKNYQIQYKTSGDSSSKDDIDHTESGLGNGTGSDTRYWFFLPR